MQSQRESEALGVGWGGLHSDGSILVDADEDRGAAGRSPIHSPGLVSPRQDRSEQNPDLQKLQELDLQKKKYSNQALACSITRSKFNGNHVNKKSSSFKHYRTGQ